MGILHAHCCIACKVCPRLNVVGRTYGPNPNPNPSSGRATEKKFSHTYLENYIFIVDLLFVVFMILIGQCVQTTIILEVASGFYDPGFCCQELRNRSPLQSH